MVARYAKSVSTAIKRVFSRMRYVALALFVGAGTFAFAVWLPNFGLIYHTLQDADAPWILRVQLPVNLLGSIQTNFSLFSATYTIAISILFGMYVAMAVYYFSRRASVFQSGGAALGVGGVVSGILGIGCAACGSVIATGALSFLGASGAVALLPLRGGEFGLLAVALLIASIAALAKKINDPLVCAPSFNQK
jgi:hypothetical protein